MPVVTSYVSSDDGLGNEDIYSPRVKWHPVDTLWRQLDDLDYADDVALLSHTQHQMQKNPYCCRRLIMFGELHLLKKHHRKHQGGRS